jgi:malonyl-CoA/methylmalonyl-CoA synthetase
VGKPLPGVGVRVVATAENGSITLLPAGEIGDVQVSGPNVFAGYWRMPEKTAEEFTTDADGRRWFKTGDVGRFDANGYLTIVGRSKDLIISGGYNVYPAEIEGYLNDMAGVAESAVIGLPHPDFGEGVVAVIVPKPGARVDADALVAELKSRIANYKVPKRAFVVPDLPRNAMGKVQKNLLRDAHRALFSG